MALSCRLTRRYHVRAAHQLGPEAHHCHELHGHNYAIEVCVEGAIHSISGMVISRDSIDEIWYRRVHAHLHAHNLNQVVEKTAGESLAATIFMWLQEELGNSLLSVAIQETKKNRFIACRFNN